MRERVGMWGSWARIDAWGGLFFAEWWMVGGLVFTNGWWMVSGLVFAEWFPIRKEKSFKKMKKKISE